MKNEVQLLFKISSLLFTLLIISPFNAVLGQEEIDLSEAIEIGLYNNFKIKIAKVETEIAGNNNTWGEAGRLPVVNFQLKDRFVLQESNNPTSFVNGKFTNNTLNPNIDVGWTIFEGFKIIANKERLAQLQEQSIGNANVVVETNVQAIMLSYYQILLEEINLNTLRETYLLSKDTYNYGKERKDMGIGSSFDLLQDKTSFLTDSSNFIKQSVNVKNAYRNLNILMGRDSETSFSVPLDTLFSKMENYSLEDLKTKMLSNNQNLLNQAINIKLLQADLRIAKSPLYPSINLNIGGDYNNLSFKTGDIRRNGYNWDLYATFTLSFTIYNGGKIRRHIENSELREEIGNLQYEDAKLELQNQLVAQLDLYNVNKELIEVARVNLEAADLQLELATERRKSGTINSIDYRNIQINQRNVALSLFQSTYNLLQSEIELIRLTGGLIL